MSTIKVIKVINPSNDIKKKTTDWMYNWWGTKENYSYEDVYMYMKNSFNKDKLPQTYLLYLDNNIIGMYQITYRDLFTRPDIYPWIANLYIDKNYRGKGFGKILIKSIKNNIQNNTDFDKVYLYTKHNNLYEKYGWKFIEKLDNDNNLYSLNIK